MNFLARKLGDVAKPLADIVNRPSPLVEVENIGLHQRNIDAVKIKQIFDIADRALSQHRQNAHPVAIIEGCHEV